jgi:hypothetical protein
LGCCCTSREAGGARAGEPANDAKAVIDAFELASVVRELAFLLEDLGLEAVLDPFWEIVEVVFLAACMAAVTISQSSSCC